MRVWMLGLVAMTVLAGPAVAQDDPQRTFLKATTVRDAEHDPKAAAKLFEQVGRNTKAPAELRTRAWLEAGRCRALVGDDTGARTAFEKAAKGEGPAARLAKDRLAGKPDEAAMRFYGRVHATVARLGDGDGDKIKRAVQELGWIGPGATPIVAAVAENEKQRLEFVTDLARVIVQLGGKEAAMFLDRARQQDDVLWRRAVLRGMVGPNWRDSHLIDAIRRWTADPDALVRAEIVDHLYYALSAEDLVRLLDDPSEDVRAKTWLRLYSLSGDSRPDYRSRVPKKLLSARLGAMLRSESRQLREGAARFMTTLWETADGRRAFLDAVIGERRDELFTVGGSGSFPSYSGGPFDTPPSPETVLEAVQAAPAASRSTRPHPATRSLFAFVLSCLDAWNEDALPTVLACIDKGYDQAHRMHSNRRASGRLTAWLLEKGGDRGLVEVSRRLDTVCRGFGLEPLAGRTTLPKAAFGGLAAFARKYADQLHHDDLNNPFVVEPVLDALVATGDRRVPGLFSELIEKSRFALPPVMERLHKLQGKEADAALARLITTAKPDNRELEGVRTMVLFELFCRGYSKPDAYVAGYRLGLPRGRVVGSAFDTEAFSDGRGLAWFNREWQPADDPRRKKLSGEEMAKILDACLSIEDGRVRAKAWRDLLEPDGSTRRIRGGLGGAAHVNLSLPSDALAVVYRRALTSARFDFIAALLTKRVAAPAELKKTLFEDVLALENRRIAGSIIASVDAPADELIPRALQAYDADRYVRDLVTMLAGWKRPDMIERIRKLIDHEDSRTRTRAWRALRLVDVDWVHRRLGRLLEGSDKGLKLWALQEAVTRVDPELAPHLLELLRDPDLTIRKQAKLALEAISLYVDHKTRWEKLKSASGLDASSAAAALIEKARSGNKDVRVAAINSLGTLAVPETLPILITWMEDEDKDIARAAKEAVAKINASKK